MTAIIIVTLILFSFHALLVSNSFWYSFLMVLSLITLIYLICLGVSPEGVEFSFFFVDPLSMSLNYLTFWVISLMLVSSSKVYKYGSHPALFIFMFLALLLSLFVAFFSKGALSFYFFFEFSLIPTIFLIMGWGYQVERVQASIYFLVYTMVASLPLLIFIFFVSGAMGGFDFFHSMFLGPVSLSFDTVFSKAVVLWAVVGAFLVKFPMYLFHLWLPKAHVEAPVSGSMILAGVLLKLGGFGVVRMSYFCLPFLTQLSFVLMSVSLISISCVSVVCLRSNDLKSLVAYSSVSHMAMAIAGLFSFFYFGVVGASLMLLGHGICSSGLFSYINMVYERSSSRSLSVNKGLTQFSVSAGLFMFILSIINMAAPPTMNLFSELFLMASVLSYSFMSVAPLMLGALLVASYCMTLFSLSHHGVSYTMSSTSLGLSECEFLILNNHIVPLVFSFSAINFVL